ncbi:MAG TPA: hypothetical protein VGC76_16535 [Pyrinomonadaceae bacterium]|jgi:hypothetical protein
MKFKLCFLLIFALSCFVSSCSRFGKHVGDANTEEIIIDDLSVEEKEKLLKSSGISLKENKYLADNLSRVEITHDDFGNKVEKQFYNNLPNIKFIAINTSANGSKQIIIYGANGSVKSLSENTMNAILRASPDELTKEVPVYNNSENQTSPSISIKSLPPVTTAPQPAQNNNQTIQTQPTPAVEIVEQPTVIKPETDTKPKEQPAAKETPAETASPKNLSKNLQIYSPKKPKNEK